MSFRQNERNRERGKKKTIRVPSLSGPRLSHAGLGKRTKQREKVLLGERERVRSLQPAVWETCSLP